MGHPSWPKASTSATLSRSLGMAIPRSVIGPDEAFPTDSTKKLLLAIMPVEAISRPDGRQSSRWNRRSHELHRGSLKSHHSHYSTGALWRQRVALDPQGLKSAIA